MKIVLALSVLVLLTSAAAQSPNEAGNVATNQPSQANLLNLGPGLAPEKIHEMVRFQAATVTRVLGVDLEVDGVLPRVYRVDHPLHLINPFAPPEYGTGFENLSVNPRTHQVEGISFLTIRF